MTLLRRHVRLWALAWFVCQATALSALVPRDCCAHHRPPATERASCHDEPPPPPPPATAYCPMHAGSGAPPAPEASQVARDADDCVMRGTCEGPPLFTLFTHVGILPDVGPALSRPSADTLPLQVAASAVIRTEPPRLRPPRLTSPSAIS